MRSLLDFETKKIKISYIQFDALTVFLKFLYTKQTDGAYFRDEIRMQLKHVPREK